MENIVVRSALLLSVIYFASCSGGSRLSDISNYHLIDECTAEQKLEIAGEGQDKEPLARVSECEAVARHADFEEITSGEKNFEETVNGYIGDGETRVDDLNQWLSRQDGDFCLWRDGGIRRNGWRSYDWICVIHNI